MDEVSNGDWEPVVKIVRIAMLIPKSLTYGVVGVKGVVGTAAPYPLLPFCPILTPVVAATIANGSIMSTCERGPSPGLDMWDSLAPSVSIRRPLLRFIYIIIVNKRLLPGLHTAYSLP
jgi:hypothetical protein